MPLAQQQLTLVPTTAGHALDGHHPDGNDGVSGTISWASVPNFINQPGSFSIPLASYLTITGGGTPSYAISLGTMPAGSNWALNTVTGDFTGTSNGGPVTFRARATVGALTADTNQFNVEVVTTPPDLDTLPPTIPTGFLVTGKTATTIDVECDAPCDVPFSTMPGRGMKELRFLKAGALDGTPTAMSPGLGLRLFPSNTPDQGNTPFPLKRPVNGHHVSISRSQASTAQGHDAAQPNGSVPGGSTGTDQSWTRTGTGPAAPGVVAVNLRYWWKEIEPTEGNPDFTRLDADLAQCHALGIYLIPFIETRTFNSNDPAPAYLSAYSDAWTTVNGSGFQMRRWEPRVYNAYKALMVKLKARYDKNTGIYLHWGGVATQETSSGNPTHAENYSQLGYFTGLCAEVDALDWTYSGGWHFHNFFSNDPDPAAPPDDAKGYLDRYQDYVVSKGGHFGGPDLLPDNAGIVKNCYPRYGRGRGRVRLFCAYQSDSWITAHTMQYLFDYARTKLHLSAHFWDFRQGGTNNFQGDAMPIIAAHADISEYDYPTTCVQSNNDYTMTARGAGFGLASDTFPMDGKCEQYGGGRVGTSGNFTCIARINPPSGTDLSAAQAGVGVRESFNNDSRGVWIVVSPVDTKAYYRSATGTPRILIGTAVGITWASATWVKLVRTGLSNWTCFYSKAGGPWTAIGGSVNVSGLVDPTRIDYLLASGNESTVTCVFKDVNIQNLPKPTHHYSGLTGGTTYGLSGAGRDLATTPNDSAASPVVNVTTLPAGATRKWNPGNYVLSNSLATGANDANTSFNNDLNNISAMAGVKGILYRYTWQVFESATAGVYDFTVLDRDLTRVLAAGKKMAIAIIPHVFSGTTPVGGAYLPDYLINDVASYGGGSDGTHSGYWLKAAPGYTAALWRAAVMDKFIALFQALAAHVDPATGQTVDVSTTVEWIEGPQADLFLAAGSDYTEASYLTQLKRWRDACVAAFPHTAVKVAASKVGSMSDLVNTTQAAPAAFGGYDVLGINATGAKYFDSQLAWTGSLDVSSVDQRGHMPLIQIVDTPELTGSAYTAQGSPFSNADLQSSLAFLGVTHAVWKTVNASGAGNWTTQVQPFLATNPATVTTRPSGW